MLETTLLPLALAAATASSPCPDRTALAVGLTAAAPVGLGLAVGFPSGASSLDNVLPFALAYAGGLGAGYVVAGQPRRGALSGIAGTALVSLSPLIATIVVWQIKNSLPTDAAWELGRQTESIARGTAITTGALVAALAALDVYGLAAPANCDN